MQVYRAYFVEDGTRWSEPLLIEELSDDRAVEVARAQGEAEDGFELWLDDHMIVRCMPDDAKRPGPARTELGPSPHAHPSVIES